MSPSSRSSRDANTADSLETQMNALRITKQSDSRGVPFPFQSPAGSMPPTDEMFWTLPEDPRQCDLTGSGRLCPRGARGGGIESATSRAMAMLCLITWRDVMQMGLVTRDALAVGTTCRTPIRT